MAVTCMCRRSQLCRPPSTQTPESFKRRSACATRSNVLVSAAAQHGEGEALRHRRRACAALRGSAAGVLARDERLSRSERRTPTPVFTLPLTCRLILPRWKVSDCLLRSEWLLLSHRVVSPSVRLWQGGLPAREAGEGIQAGHKFLGSPGTLRDKASRQ